MSKLKDLWDELRTLDPTDTRRKDVQKEINRIEQWCIDQGREGFKITKWNDNEYSPSKNYPEKSGAIWFGDWEGLNRVIQKDKI